MSWFAAALKSNIGRKWVVSLTGLFLILFLVVHVSGNFTLLNAGADAGASFNAYSEFMGQNPLIQTVAWITKILILIHIFQSLYLWMLNRKARGTNYAYQKPGETSSWSSRNMTILGTIILIFLIMHLKTFWFVVHYGEVPFVNGDPSMGQDYFALVLAAFSDPIYVGFYLLALIGLSFHLWHGFQSAFQTLGLEHKKYTPFIKILGRVISIFVPIGFSTQPLYVFFLSN